MIELGSRWIFQAVRSCTFLKTQPKKNTQSPNPNSTGLFSKVIPVEKSTIFTSNHARAARQWNWVRQNNPSFIRLYLGVVSPKKQPLAILLVPFLGWLKWLLQRLSDLQIGHKKYKKVTLNHLAERINCDWWCYLEDHPRYRIWLGSPPFISHGVRPFGKGPRTRSLGDLLTITIVSNYDTWGPILQVLLWKWHSNSNN